MWLEKAISLDIESIGQGVIKGCHLVSTKALVVARIRATPVIQAVAKVKGEIPRKAHDDSYVSLYESLCESQ